MLLTTEQLRVIIIMFTHAVSTIRLESRVSYIGPDCRVSQQRKSQLDLRPQWVTAWSSMGQQDSRWDVLDTLTSLFPFAAGAVDATGSINPAERFLAGYDDVYALRDWNSSSYTDISDNDFSIRFSTLLNTYWLATQAYDLISSHLGPSNITIDHNLGTHFNNVTVARWVRTQCAKRGWIASLIIITFILQAAAVAGLVFKYLCRQPETLGWISSLTRNNMFTPLPAGGSTLSGVERAKLLGDRTVKLGDVQKEAEIGSIALAWCDDRVERGKTHAFDRNRKYL